MKTCFAILPFASEFTPVDKALRVAARRCGLRYVRGDAPEESGRIMPQILREIERAEVIVADISPDTKGHHNPNVFYELGIAHQVRGPERVVIITQQVDGKAAFDIHQYRQLTYANHPKGRAELGRKLPKRLREAAASDVDQEFWNVIRGQLPRTKVIARHLALLTEGKDRRQLAGLTIRVAAGLSSLAICESERDDRTADREYIDALLTERDALRDVLARGARLKAVLNPPRRFARSMKPRRLRARFQRLIRLLEGHSDIKGNPKAAADDIKAIRRSQIALSPVASPNLLIIGDQVAYEGMKRGGTGGFEMTHCEKNREAVRQLIRQFDQHFDQSRRDMKRRGGSRRTVVSELRRYLREATAA